MYSPKAALPQPISMSTPKASPQTTQTSDSRAPVGGRLVVVAVSVQIDAEQHGDGQAEPDPRPMGYVEVGEIVACGLVASRQNSAVR